MLQLCFSYMKTSWLHLDPNSILESKTSCSFSHILFLFLPIYWNKWELKLQFLCFKVRKSPWNRNNTLFFPKTFVVLSSARWWLVTNIVRSFPPPISIPDQITGPLILGQDTSHAVRDRMETVSSPKHNVCSPAASRDKKTQKKLNTFLSYWSKGKQKKSRPYLRTADTNLANPSWTRALNVGQRDIWCRRRDVVWLNHVWLRNVVTSYCSGFFSSHNDGLRVDYDCVHSSGRADERRHPLWGRRRCSSQRNKCPSVIFSLYQSAAFIW